MRCPHPAQRALSPIQLTIGRFSYHRRGRAQCGHRERGLTMDCLAGSRRMQTFRKLPTAAPASAKNAVVSTSGIRSRPRPRLRAERKWVVRRSVRHRCLSGDGIEHIGHTRRIQRRSARCTRTWRQCSPRRHRTPGLRAHACEPGIQRIQIVEHAQLHQPVPGDPAQVVVLTGLEHLLPERARCRAVAALRERDRRKRREPFGRARDRTRTLEPGRRRLIVAQPPVVHEPDVLQVLPARGIRGEPFLQQRNCRARAARRRSDGPRPGTRLRSGTRC